MIPELINVMYSDILVKPVKENLTYDQAIKYCSEPNKKISKYIADWKLVSLGGFEYPTSISTHSDEQDTEVRYWIQQDDNKSDKVSIGYNLEVPKDSIGIYTFCITPSSNLKDAYLFYLPPPISSSSTSSDD